MTSQVIAKTTTSRSSNAALVRYTAARLGKGGAWIKIEYLRTFLRDATKKQWHEGYILSALMRGPFVCERGAYFVKKGA